jgi:spore coat polysaccharide biosynthesis protein SpsF
MLGHLVDRLRRVPSLHDIVLATTVNDADMPICDFGASAGVGVFRGSEEDVMRRVIRAAEWSQADIIVHLTGDCPLIDPLLVEETIRAFLTNECDYAANSHVRSYPDGMDTQVFRSETLERSAGMTDDPLDHEHVTLHIRRHPEIFRHFNVIAPTALHWPELGLTLDEADDYELIKRIVEHFGPENAFFSCADVIGLLRTNPEWVEINRGVRRKGDS